MLETSEVGDEAGWSPSPGTCVNQDERVVTRARVEVLWRRDGDGDAEQADEYAVSGFVPIPL